MALFDWMFPAAAGDIRRIDVDVKKLKDDLSALRAKVVAAEQKEGQDIASIQAAIQALKDKIAAGETVTQADIDALGGQVAEIGPHIDNMTAALDAEVAAEQPAPPPAPPAA